MPDGVAVQRISVRENSLSLVVKGVIRHWLPPCSWWHRMLLQHQHLQ